MSIVALSSDNSRTNIQLADLNRIAASLNFNIKDDSDGEAYLVLLRSFEQVMQHIEDAPDYAHPALMPQQTLGCTVREYHKPDPQDNPMNAWSNRCRLISAHPTNDLLKGRSIAIKDNISVGGLPTTLGTHPEILCGSGGKLPVSTIDATVVARLLAAGAVIEGTSTCENFCASPLSWTSASGPVHHPLLRGYTSGGSSSGSCALVAAHHQHSDRGAAESLGPTVELAVGSDQAGSVRNPACYTGLYGLKPTFGLVPYTGASSMSPMIDHLGPIAHGLVDIALLLKVMAGWDGIDSRMTPESPTVDQVPDYPSLLTAYIDSIAGSPDDQLQSQLKVGLLSESFSVPGISTDVAEMIINTAKSAFTAAGASVKFISVPMHSEGPAIWTAATRPSMAQTLSHGRPLGHLSYLAPHIRPQWPPDQQMYDLLNKSNPALVNILLSGALSDESSGAPSCPPSWLEAKAHRKVFELRAAYDKALKEVDVLVLPCVPTVSMPHPDLRADASILDKLASAVGLTSNTCPFNVSGHPAMSVPCGALPVVADEAGKAVLMPVGMQIVGRRWQDIEVLKAAALFEAGMKAA